MNKKDILAGLGIILAAPPLPKDTMVKIIEPKVITPVVIESSGREKRRKRRAMERKLKKDKLI